MSEKTSSSIINTISGYVTSKKMIYLVGAIVLSVGIYFYMNKKSKAEEIKTEAPNQEQEQQQNGEPEIIFSQELVQNLYQNNSNPIKYLQLLQQQGQIPNGPLPKIVLDYNINAENNQVNNLPQVQEERLPQKSDAEFLLSNYEMGLKGDYSKFDFSLVGFLSNYEDLIELSKVGEDPACVSVSFYRAPCDISQSVNRDEAEIYGLEFTSEYSFNENKEGFSVLTSLAYSHGDDKTSSDSEPLTSIEPFKAIVGLKYRGLANKWSAELTNTYVGDARTTAALEDNPSESYSVLDLTSVFNVSERLSVDVGIFNLNDTRYFNYSTVQSKKSSDADVNRFSEPGRNIKAGFKFIF